AESYASSEPAPANRTNSASATTTNDRLRTCWSLSDVHERPDRCVGPHLTGWTQLHLDAAEALREPELRASERMQSVAAVEVADELDPWVAVVAAAGVGAAHRADADVLVDGVCPGGSGLR